MITPYIATNFARVPRELIELCRSHAWTALTTPPAAGLRSIRDILDHIAGAEKRWIHAIILGKPWTRWEFDPFDDLDALMAGWGPQREATVAFLRSLTTDQWDATRSMPWDPNLHRTVGDIVWHVVTHEQYHRGQLFARLALLGRRDLPDQDLLR